MATINASSETLVKVEEEHPYHGDILEEILSHVPLIDLIPALQVSKSWNQAVYSSLRSCRNPPKPWLILHTQSARYPYAAVSTHAYDPRSRLWMKISQPSTENPSPLRSSNSNFLYMYPPSINLSFSVDPLNLTWHRAGSPTICRLDPIVAKLGGSIIVAGGAYFFEDDPLAVEIYDTNSREWRKTESMPEDLMGSSSSTWLSVAATDEKLYVMKKHSGEFHCFDLQSNSWSSPGNLRPDPRCFYSVIGHMLEDDRLILVGLIRDVDEKVEKVKIWEAVNCDRSFGYSFREIGEMPPGLLEKLKGESSRVCSIDICTGGSFVYIYKPEDVAGIVVCELVNGGACYWGSVGNPVADRGGAWVVLTCAEVKLEELRRGLKLNGCKFEYVNV
ncbi:OLC1v1028337C1 [Oldenlandia corymbosa var. corymbosa]|uniref:OLC1v1028337C1 n=1 Tax=Oldenlandia corymbosa var. corymbosa TaxID=529605 RepID=A0AAV1CE51_OLDCO|nr:OLC1v1028337C1 [Oldenlandia corymbosa var. corymbosa]